MGLETAFKLCLETALLTRGKGILGLAGLDCMA